MEADKAKQDLARWQSLTLKDLMCLNYWINIGLTIGLVFNTFDFLSNFTSTPTRKFSSLVVLWTVSIAFYQTILGTTGLLKSVLICKSYDFILSFSLLPKGTILSFLPLPSLIKIKFSSKLIRQISNLHNSLTRRPVPSRNSNMSL